MNGKKNNLVMEILKKLIENQNEDGVSWKV